MKRAFFTRFSSTAPGWQGSCLDLPYEPEGGELQINNPMLIQLVSRGKEVCRVNHLTGVVSKAGFLTALPVGLVKEES